MITPPFFFAPLGFSSGRFCFGGHQPPVRRIPGGPDSDFGARYFFLRRDVFLNPILMRVER